MLGVLENRSQIFGFALSLAFWKTGDNFLRPALLEGKNPSHGSIPCVFPGTPLTSDAIPSACRNVFATPDQRKKIIFIQICELIQLLLCSQANRGAAATEDIDPHHWGKGRGGGVRMPLSPGMRSCAVSVLIRQAPCGFSKVRGCGPLH